MPITYPARNSQLTDREVANALRVGFPLSHQKAASVCDCARKARKGGGILVSERTRRQILHKKILELDQVIGAEGFATEAIETGLQSKMEQRERANFQTLRVFEFLTVFASAYPNWPDECEYLNSFIGPSLFP